MSIAVHRSAEPAPADRGRGFGRAQSDAVANTLTAYRQMFADAHGLDIPEIRRLGEGVRDVLASECPDLAEEIAGLAAGSGQDERDLFAVNARTEILRGASAPECTAIGAVPPAAANGKTLLAQNWDWHPDLASSRVLWWIEDSSERWFVTLTEAGLLGKIGLNSRGVGVCLNLLSTSSDGGISGTPIHILLRQILQCADNLSEALRILLNTHVSASSCFTLAYAEADGEGAVVSVERTPDAARLVWPEPEGWLVHTNHLRQPAAPGVEDRYAREYPDTLVRLWHMERALRAAKEPVTPEAMQQLLCSHFNGPLAVCCHDPDNARYLDCQETLASVILDLGSRSMRVADGAPCSTPFEPVVRPQSRPAVATA